MVKRLFTVLLACLTTLSLCPLGSPAIAQTAEAGDEVAQVLKSMSLEEKIAQMIIVAMRTWDKKEVVDLEAQPELAEALRRHQYGGVILFGQNVENAEQVAKFIGQLQDNNKQVKHNSQNAYVPYAIAIDEEGGSVTRLKDGTRMTGSTAIGATTQNAEQNARTTGEVIGEELAALGINVNFAPVVDETLNPRDPSMGTRCFCDDPDTVAQLGAAYIEGLSKSNVSATLKHFPGSGFAEDDSHSQKVIINRSLDEMRAAELVPFAKNNKNADMIMTAHITLPQIAEQITLPNGSEGYYPATMSKRVITDLLRGELGYDGVVVTDALEMGAIAEEGLVPGAKDSLEYRANVAEKVINAGVDILLIPTDLKGNESVTFYDEYLTELANRVKSGAISEERIDQSVTRILKLKAKRGYLKEPAQAKDVKTVGSDEHHAKEMQIAREAITLLKNDNQTLPLTGSEKSIVLLGRFETDGPTISYTIDQLKQSGFVNKDAYVRNLATGKTSGNSDASTSILIDYYLQKDGDTKFKEHYTDELAQAIGKASAVVVFTACNSAEAIANDAPQHLCVARAIEQAHAAGAKFVLMTNSLPYDAARYQQADAILATYLSAGLDQDPTTRKDGSANMGAVNANVIAGLNVLFGEASPNGKLPIGVPTVVEKDGKVEFSATEKLYPHGHGLTFEARTPTQEASKEQKQGQGQGTENASAAFPTGIVVAIVGCVVVAAVVVWMRSKRQS